MCAVGNGLERPVLVHVFVTLFSIASRELVFTPFFALVRHDFLICGKVIWEAMYDRACLLFRFNEAKKEVCTFEKEACLNYFPVAYLICYNLLVS